MKFIKQILAVIIGIFIAFFLLFLVLGILGSVIGGKEKVDIKENTVLVLDMSGELPDYKPSSSNPFEQLIDEEMPRISFTKLLNAIENAKKDKKIAGISLEFPTLNLGIAQAQELRDKLSDFKSSGKFITAFSDFYSQKNYYISSVADSVYIQKEGHIDFRGLASEKLYFKDFQDRTGIRMEVIRHGKYKSAMEGFLANEMSDANREQTVSLLHSIWEEMLDDIAASRHTDTGELNRIVDTHAPATPQEAVSLRLIDKSLYYDQYLDILSRLSQNQDNKKPRTVSIQKYLKAGKGRIHSAGAKDKIAIVYAQGDIRYGKGDETYIGNESIIEALKKLRKNKGVKAIVLRINSPGGSALASELIWREIELTKKEKPVVVSMGNLAASGGYYIACNADKIIAEPTTITGSIGVFGALPNVSEFAARHGINAEQVYTNTSPHYSMFEPLDSSFHDFTAKTVEQVYHTFVSHVAEGRNMSFDQVDKIAQGRVWTGKEALENGLVDRLGSLDTAVGEAASLAGIDKFKLRSYPRYKKDFKDMFSKFPFGKTESQWLREQLGDEYYRMYRELKDLHSLQGIQARLPYVLNIR